MDEESATEYKVPVNGAEIVELEMNIGNGVLVKVDLPHFGVSYSTLNFRIHFTVTPMNPEEHHLDAEEIHTRDIVFFPE